MIEDHRPLLARLRELLVNGGGQGQGNGTAGVEEAQVMTDYSELLLKAKILSADMPKLQR